MRLKRLQLFGFKSFADRTTFDFGDKTLTGVVGPNGCGKSNIVDATRWVLGEQRPTSMRGAEMTDVIFKGSASRPPLSVAEVTLVLDNSTGVLAGRGAEVSIMRRVFKSGEGEYLLDGEKVRLKDIKEMLFDTGLGSRGYSVLEQGKIDSVLSANPLERRRIFEEAAGVSRYRQRKNEAELRLKRVAEDMARLDDVIGELGSRVRSLKIQAGKAERYVAARDEWARERARLLKHRARQGAELLRELRGQAARIEARVETARASREEAEGGLQLREKEAEALAGRIEGLVADASRLSGDGRMVDERKAQLASRAGQREHAAREEGGRASRLAALLSEREAELARIAGELAELEGGARSAHEEHMERARAQGDLDSQSQRLRVAIERLSGSVQRLLVARTQAENRIAALDAALVPLKERVGLASTRLSEALAVVEALRIEQASHEAAAAEAARAQGEHEVRRRELAQAMQDAAAAVARADQEKKQLELERARAQSTIEVLLARERDLEELSAGAKKVLEAIEKRGEPFGRDALLGLVADHLRTSVEHARALDAALAGRAGALVVDRPERVAAVVDWLNSKEAGQVSLVVAGGFGAGEADESGLSDDERVLGTLLARVEVDEGYEGLARSLLSGVWLARDLEAAMSLVASHPSLRFVTPRGELVDAACAHGGHRAAGQGAVSRRSSAAELRGKVDDLDRRIEELDARRGEVVAARIGLQKEWEQSSLELETRRVARTAAETALSTARARLADQDALKRGIEQESSSAEAQIARMESELDQARAARGSADAEHERESAALAAEESRRAELEERRDSSARELARSQLAASTLRAEHDGLARRVRDLRAVVEETRLESARAARLAGEHEVQSREDREEVAKLEERSAAILAQRAGIDEEVGELRGRLDGARLVVAQSRVALDALAKELEGLASRLSELRLEEQRVALARDEIVRRAQEELSIDELALSEGFEPEAALSAAEALDALDAQVRELKARLDKLGPVNMEAMAELEEAGGRLSFLETQRADLAQARTSLEETIATIDGESKKLFLETFEAVRANFQRIFRQLFGGGKADVTLEEGADPLDAGVDIYARPPGRELLPISLLSGGQRTMTALALLFAVFEARPSPFCILDEVDAALDEANVGRFLAMLDGFRSHTQFVVVTHKKLTMAACQGLYGVTMEVKGVSRQVSVELGDVERWAGRDHSSAKVVEEAVAPRSRATVLDAESGEPVVELAPAPRVERIEPGPVPVEPASSTLE